MTAEEVAKYWQIAPKTVLNLARKGKIPSKKIGGSRRFDPFECDKVVKNKFNEN